MDPIANMLCAIKNATTKKKERVDVPFSGIKAGLVKLLKDEGFVSNFKVLDPKLDKTIDRRGVIRITLKYTMDKQPVINGIRRVSKPGLRIYRGHDEMPHVRAAFGENRKRSLPVIGSTVPGIIWFSMARCARCETGLPSPGAISIWTMA